MKAGQNFKSTRRISPPALAYVRAHYRRQLLPRGDGTLTLVAPAECRENPRVAAYCDALVAGGGPIAEIPSFDLRQSMRNGGGPACLRLNVPLNSDERDAIGARVFLDESLAAELEAWIARNYRDRLGPEDLADPSLIDESRRALDELTTILRLPSIYPFQRA
jgi:succinylarginine dihydrolase